MRLSWLLLLLALTACSHATPVYLGSDEPTSVVDATASAVAWWNEQIGYEALSVRMVPSIHATWLDPLSIRVRSVARTGNGSSAENVFGVGLVSVERSALDGSLTDTMVIAHELGHQFGLSHAGQCDVVNLDAPRECLDGDHPTGNVMFAGHVAARAYFSVEPRLTSTRAQRRTVRRWLLARTVAVPLH